ncbi:SDR family oxidoreductase [Myxococcus llanfairpwllgwyngyllgogerychwyrndrobwllllantysiliogogogochensis]|uniref:SDR family oxidoreductase n=1 Tax=Myxococcus llanfairpwllgwyngyllgogerychwyrndrobwllllantysiliogogogochensis TaxID=2590453 RepID=A0A540WNQ4_9BACT|nr:SDR family oxidoreductase [Myxococcus llanfairpwllgwyngyllgogerychwyrndrobwllllantysiliogogogochensis]TQF10655.1 SDR family oxidoreductase [Myxococcus llanfairpwllgwyngyllgogerychwyrndrobwllllantysiliogogogochensis]
MDTSQGSKVVLVTGASSGIGEACVELLTVRKHIVYGTSRQPSVRESVGYRMLEMDVTQDASVRRAVETVLAREGRIDVVVNNAGHALAGAVEDTSVEEAWRQLDTNVLGVLRVCQAVLPSMRERRSGRIINISSLGGAVGLPFQGFYSASKFALEGLTESLRQEVEAFGIHATLVQPGDVRTRLTDNRVRAAASGEGSAYRESFEKVLAIIEKEEREGVPSEDVARRVLEVMEVEAPDVRYSVGKLAQRAALVAKALLPAKTFEGILMSMYGLKRR